MANIANIAATNMEHLCNCPLHGYSQAERWGDSSKGICYVECEGHTSTFYAGDRDCSSAICDAWQEALIGTAYEGVLAGATYTGNMREVFVNSGLFEWYDMSFSASRGDIYLNEVNHTAMCLDGGNDGVYGADMLGEFCISETGGIYGESGDQTGGESIIHGYYNYPWDGILHYNGKANDTSGSSDGPQPEPVPTPRPSSNRMHIIDIASWQEGIIPSQTSADVVIIKVSGGTHYENPLWRQWADDVLASGKALGLYHYAVESEGGPQAKAEAEFFLSKIGDYIGKFIPILDWEADALSLPASWAREWMDIVAERTGATPWFYGYASDVNSKDYWPVAEKYPLWMASYLNKYQGAGFLDDPDQTWGYGSWSSAIAYQYTSTGRISGYGGDLDLSVGYLSAQDWANMCGGGHAPQPAPQPSGNQPRYAVNASGYGWLSEMEGLRDTGGSGDDFAGVIGAPAIYIGVNNIGNYRIYSQANGWLPYVDHLNYNDEENGMAGDGSPILALEIPNSSIKYQVHAGGLWYPWMIGNQDTGGSNDTYAGDMSNPIDGVRITRI